jgi:hypothetical protein
MKKINPSKIVVFVAIVILSVFLFMAYDILKPVQNFTTATTLFPTLKPSDIPSFQNTINSCYFNPEPCSGEGDDACRACGDSDEFQCVTVSEMDNIVVNGIKLQPGKWCVPKYSEKRCNPYTGVWTWEQSSTCPGGGQCWRCNCAYPSLYTNEIGGCETQVGCKMGNQVSRLVLTKEGQKDLEQKTGKLWPIGTPYDPLYDIDTITDEQAEFMNTVKPYDVDKQGKPYFKCACDDPYYVQIDPNFYQCQNFPCYPNTQKSTGERPTWSMDKQQCICSANLQPIPRGDLKGQCFDIKMCQVNGGEYDTKNQLCTFTGKKTENGGFIAQKCNSQYVKWDDKTPKCKDSQNPIGSEIVDKCAEMRNKTSFQKFGAGITWDGQKCIVTCKPTGDERGRIYKPEDFCATLFFPPGAEFESCYMVPGDRPFLHCDHPFAKEECCYDNGGTACAPPP